jgi:hypothetical protein
MNLHIKETKLLWRILLIQLMVTTALILTVTRGEETAIAGVALRGCVSGESHRVCIRVPGFNARTF